MEEDIFATGKNVIVIGGGDTGSDCVGTSNRHGAKTITQFELLPQPPKERTSFMPWPTYPMILKTTSSHEEGCERQWAMATKEFIGDENGNLKALKIVQLEWKLTDDGRPARFVEVAGTEEIIPCELALLAMGFVHPQQDGLVNDLGVELDERGMSGPQKNHIRPMLKKYLPPAICAAVSHWLYGPSVKVENAPAKWMNS